VCRAFLGRFSIRVVLKAEKVVLNGMVPGIEYGLVEAMQTGTVLSVALVAQGESPLDRSSAGVEL
jgi:hypothetical protein